MEKSVEGVIVRGLGEGAYFMSMRHYRDEIKKKLGFDAYPGTLNLKVSKKQMDLLEEAVPIRIDGFQQENKIFGEADCYKAKINGTLGAIIVPKMTKHKDVMEFIAPVHLKSELKLEDGDKIKVELVV
ncbi:CTP-dependent riboflavin kinase [Candidatus Woesearchaeota archaeon]|nr:CTP-dependent riboflavin kinase [Candidatus Woesearchaeota archaeon]